MQAVATMAFQSTPSSRRETMSGSRDGRAQAYFNPLPPRGGRPVRGVFVAISVDISIHSLLAEGDA